MTGRQAHEAALLAVEPAIAATAPAVLALVRTHEVRGGDIFLLRSRVEALLLSSLVGPVSVAILKARGEWPPLEQGSSAGD